MVLFNENAPFLFEAECSRSIFVPLSCFSAFERKQAELVLLSIMANQRVLPQSKETLLQNYNKRLKDDIKSIMDNFTEIVKTAKAALWFLNLACFPPSSKICPEFTASLSQFPSPSFIFVQIEDETQVSRPTQAEQDHYEMHVRAANIVSETQSVIDTKHSASCIN